MKKFRNAAALFLSVILTAACFTFAGCTKFLTYAGAALPGGTVGEAYSQSVASAKDGNKVIEIIYTLNDEDGDEIPDGLALNEDGTISGIPTRYAEGEYELIIVASAKGYKNVEAEFTIKIDKPSVSFNGAELAAGRLGASYAQSIDFASVYTGSSSISYSLKFGSRLPGGLDIHGNAIEGTPNEIVTGHKFTLIASAGTDFYNAEAEFTITVGKAEFIYAGKTLNAGSVGASYSDTAALAAAGYGSPAITYSLKTGSSVPAGLVFGNGAISGTPATTGDYKFTVIASADNHEDKEAEFGISIMPAGTIFTPITYNDSDLADGTVGKSYTADAATASATGDPAITYSASAGALPTGLSLSADGTISGTPEKGAAGEYIVTIEAAAAGAYTKAYADFTLKIYDISKMETEDIDLVDFKGIGYSNSQDGYTAVMDKGLASGGEALGYCHGAGISITYQFEADADTTGELILCLGSDAKANIVPITSDELEVKINGGAAFVFGPYDLSNVYFTDCLISDSISITKGYNEITVTVLENNLETGYGTGSFTAFGPLFDCLRITSTANIQWYRYNINGFIGLDY